MGTWCAAPDACRHESRPRDPGGGACTEKAQCPGRRRRLEAPRAPSGVVRRRQAAARGGVAGARRGWLRPGGRLGSGHGPAAASLSGVSAVDCRDCSPAPALGDGGLTGGGEISPPASGDLHVCGERKGSGEMGAPAGVGGGAVSRAHRV